MKTPLNYACALALLPLACGPITEAEGGGSETGTSSSEGGSSVSVTTTMTTMTTTTASTSMSTTEPTSTDPTTTDPTTESTDPDSSSGGGGNGCCEVHAGAGCEEEAVEQCVCKASPDCCVFGWEKNCVDVAMNMCDATCMGAEESSSGGSESTGEPVSCDEPVQIELGADVATLNGAWFLDMSQVGEGMIAHLEGLGDSEMDTIVWDIDIPCDAEWYIWVRGTDFGSFDSCFATLDGEPAPAPIFELDCDNGGDSYVWARLNQRDPVMGMACDYVEDPWIANWTAGPHTFELAWRESEAIARIVVTNDEGFTPM